MGTPRVCFPVCVASFVGYVNSSYSKYMFSDLGMGEKMSFDSRDGSC